MMKTPSFPARLSNNLTIVCLCFAAVTFSQGFCQAKGGEGQAQIILLNDSAAALEDSDPALSKELSGLADRKEEEWRAQNAKGDQKTPAEKSSQEERREAKILRKAAFAVEGTYPLIAQGLRQMAEGLGQETMDIPGVHAGMAKADFFKIYPQSKLRGFRHEGDDEWITYNEPLNDPLHGLDTFYFHKGILTQWKLDDRNEFIQEYLDEFCFYQEPSAIYKAIKEVLRKIPYKDFLNITNRNRPVLFTEFYDSGTARFASSSEFIVNGEYPACCQEGFTIIKLGMGLGLSKDPGPIEAVVAHEIAHRVLDTIKKGNINCQAERDANVLVRKWGFVHEFKEASSLFGQKKGDPAACQEKK